MKPRDWWKLFLVSLALTVGRLADEGSTYLTDPGLKYEVNIFMRQVWFRLGLGWNWTMIAVAEAIFVLALIVGEWYYLRKYRSLFPSEAGYSMKRFLGFCCYGQEPSRRRRLKRQVILGIYVLVTVTLALSYWAAANNIFLVVVIQPIIEVDLHHWSIEAFDAVQKVLLVIVPAASLIFGLSAMHRRWYKEYLARTGTNAG